MQAYKLAVTISEHRTVQLPLDVPAGPAEVIVLLSSPPTSSAGEDSPRNEALFRFLETMQKVDQPRRSKEEIDAELAEERATWEDRA
jgi:hypothetical protein